MSSSIVPTTLVGVKRLARQIARSGDAPHAEALDRAAVAAGFHNFAHARHALAPHAVGLTASSSPTFAEPVDHAVISMNWRDADRFGIVAVKAPLSVRLPGYTLKTVRGVPGFLDASPDGEAFHFNSSLQRRSAVEDITRLARTLAFSLGTGLIRSKGFASAMPNRSSWQTDLPEAHDHVSIWWDAIDRRHFATDEPYTMGDESGSHAFAAAAWRDRTGWFYEEPEWPGMWYPEGGTRLFVAGNPAKGSPDRVMQCISMLPRPVTSLDCYDEWVRERPAKAA